jgi:Mitochondrial carrier protein
MSAQPRKANLLESMALGGTSAVFAVNFTHPIETVKTRMQVSGLGIGQTASTLYANEGVAAFWKGILFAYGREISYTSIKLGGQ